MIKQWIFDVQFLIDWKPVLWCKKPSDYGCDNEEMKQMWLFYQLGVEKEILPIHVSTTVIISSKCSFYFKHFVAK